MRYRASPQLEAFLLANAPPHVAVDNAPSTLDELLDAVKDGAPLPVWVGGCDTSIYSCAAVNYAFRAWHDSLHIELRAELDLDGMGEYCVDILQRRRAVAAGLSTDDVMALHYETWGQVVYAARHAGQFPSDQAAFIAACFENYHAAIDATF